jgi:hypothetical protein
MYKAKDGKAFGNHEMGKRYDESRPKAGPAEREMGGEEEHEQPIEEAVEEHGPAEHVEVHVHHKDGHVHKSKHHDAESAREHVSKAFGDEGEHAGMEHGGGEEAAMPSAIPGMG